MMCSATTIPMRIFHGILLIGSMETIIEKVPQKSFKATGIFGLQTSVY